MVCNVHLAPEDGGAVIPVTVQSSGPYTVAPRRLRIEVFDMMLLIAMLVNHPALLCCLMLPAPSAARQEDPAPSTGIDLRIDPLADLVGFARHLAERPAHDDPPQLATAVDAVRNLNRGFGRSGFLAFGIIDCQLLPGDGVAAFAARLAQLPEEISLPGGAKAPLRTEAARLGVALVQAESWFMEEVWPDHRAELERTRARIEAAFVPHETACFDCTRPVKPMANEA